MTDTRTRSRSTYVESITPTIEKSTYNISTGWSDPTVTLGTALCPESMVEVMTDVVTPNFHKRRSKGEIINNPLTSTKTYHYENQMPYSYEFINRNTDDNSISYGMRESGDVTGAYMPGKLARDPFPTLDNVGEDAIESLEDQAITSAHASIGNNDTLALVTALEMGKTFTSLGGLLKGVTKIHKHVAKRAHKISRSNLRQDARLYADLWMEARYSLRPLYYDVVGLLKAIDRPLKKLDRATFRGSAQYEDSVESTEVTELWDSGHPGSTFNVVRKVEKQIYVRGGCLCKTCPEDRAMALGLNEIPSTLWEIVPFSFIVDWFFNVGDTIQAWTPRMGTNVLASWVTTTTVDTTTMTHSAPTNTAPVSGSNVYQAGAGYSFSSGIVTDVVTTRVRKPNPTRPILPSFTVNMSLAKSIDLGIILSNLFKSGDNVKKWRI